MKWCELRGHGHILISYLISTLKGATKATTEDFLKLNTLRGKKTALLTPKRYDKHPRHFYMEARSPPGGACGILVSFLAMIKTCYREGIHVFSLTKNGSVIQLFTPPLFRLEDAWVSRQAIYTLVTLLASYTASHADAALYTGRTLRKRFGEHLRSVTKCAPGFPVAEHFSSHGHSLDNAQALGVKPCGGNKQWKRHEMRLIFQLGTWQPRGLNSDFRYCWGPRAGLLAPIISFKNSDVFMAWQYQTVFPLQLMKGYARNVFFFFCTFKQIL